MRTIVKVRDLREVEVWSFGINRSCDRGDLARVRACTYMLTTLSVIE